MKRRTLAVALAGLLLVSGVAGLVAADRQPSIASEPTVLGDGATTARADDGGDENATTDDGSATDEASADDAAALERRVRERLAGFDLTDEQVDAVVARALELREAGASNRVVRSMVVTTLWEYGVDAPSLYADPVEKRLAWLGGQFELTDEQLAEIERTVEAMLDEGADRREIREAVSRLLDSYGVSAAEIRDARSRQLHQRAHRLDARADGLDDRAHRLHHRAYRLDSVGDGDASDGDAGDGSGDHSAVARRIAERLQSAYDLTDDRTAEVARTVASMLDDGADRGEIREAVRRLFSSWGIEVPDDGPGWGRADGSR